MKVAVVDEKIEFLQEMEDALNRVLTQLGEAAVEVTPYTSAQSFLGEYERGRFDVVFTDVKIGEASGIDLAFALRKIDPDIALIFMTSCNCFAAESYLVHAFSYLLKPVDEKALRSVMARLKRKLEPVEEAGFF